MGLYQDLLEWQERLTALAAEGEALLARVAQLEEEHTALMAEKYQTSGFEALSKLYDEGYHICPANFARQREEDCLFCVNFLLYKGRKA